MPDRWGPFDADFCNGSDAYRVVAARLCEPGPLFGPNAELDVQGSFHATTADYIKLADGVRFNALPSAEDARCSPPPLPSFRIFSTEPEGDHRGRWYTLEAREGRGLSVVGGDVTIRRGELRAPEGGLRVASAASPGEVALTKTGVRMDSIVRHGDIAVLDGSRLDVSAERAGSVHIVGGEIRLAGSGSLPSVGAEEPSSVVANTGNKDGGPTVIEADTLSFPTVRLLLAEAVAFGWLVLY